MKKRASKKQQEKPLNLKRNFIFKNGEEIHILNIRDLYSMHYNEALEFAQVAHFEQKNQFFLEAQKKAKPLIIKGISLLDGLEHSLTKLDEIWPGIRETVSKIEQVKNSGRIIKC